MDGDSYLINEERNITSFNIDPFLEGLSDENKRRIVQAYQELLSNEEVTAEDIHNTHDILEKSKVVRNATIEDLSRLQTDNLFISPEERNDFITKIDNETEVRSAPQNVIENVTAEQYNSTRQEELIR